MPHPSCPHTVLPVSSTNPGEPFQLPLEFDPTPPVQRPSRGPLVVPPTALVSAAAAAAFQYVDTDEWHDSPFAKIRNLPAASRGKAAVSMVENLLHQTGFRVAPRRSSGHDCLVEGRTVRVKLSTLWRSGLYTFQQIRNEDYEIMFLLGLSPQEGHAWVVSRAVALSLAGHPTAWIAFPPHDPPEPLLSAGGSLSALAPALLQAFGPPSNVSHSPMVPPEPQQRP